jgi:hypothetical protein
MSQQQPADTRKIFTVGARVKCATPGLRLHVTLACVGDCDQDRVNAISLALTERAAMPIRFTLGQRDMFGPKNDIPVIRCSFTDPKCADSWAQFYTRFSELPPGMPGPKPRTQNYHVSIKKPGAEQELQDRREIVCTSLYLEQIGPHEPILSIPLPVVE